MKSLLQLFRSLIPTQPLMRPRALLPERKEVLELCLSNLWPPLKPIPSPFSPPLPQIAHPFYIPQKRLGSSHRPNLLYLLTPFLCGAPQLWKCFPPAKTIVSAPNYVCALEPTKGATTFNRPLRPAIQYCWPPSLPLLREVPRVQTCSNDTRRVDWELSFFFPGMCCPQPLRHLDNWLELSQPLGLLNVWTSSTTLNLTLDLHPSRISRWIHNRSTDPLTPN